MKKRSAVWLFVCGSICGLSLALCLNAAEKKSAPPQVMRPDWSRLKLVSYPTGLTGILDPDSGRIYVYDMNLVDCYSIREITTLGEPLRRLRN